MIDQELLRRHPRYPWLLERRDGHWKIYEFQDYTSIPSFDQALKVFKMPIIKNASLGISIEDIVCEHSYTGSK